MKKIIFILGILITVNSYSQRVIDLPSATTYLPVDYLLLEPLSTSGNTSKIAMSDIFGDFTAYDSLKSLGEFRCDDTARFIVPIYIDGNLFNGTGVGGTASGSTGNIQFNTSNVFDFDNELFWDKSNNILRVKNSHIKDTLIIIDNSGADTTLIYDDGDTIRIVGKNSISIKSDQAILLKANGLSTSFTINNNLIYNGVDTVAFLSDITTDSIIASLTSSAKLNIDTFYVELSNDTTLKVTPDTALIKTNTKIDSSLIVEDIKSLDNSLTISNSTNSIVLDVDTVRAENETGIFKNIFLSIGGLFTGEKAEIDTVLTNALSVNGGDYILTSDTSLFQNEINNADSLSNNWATLDSAGIDLIKGKTNLDTVTIKKDLHVLGQLKRGEEAHGYAAFADSAITFTFASGDTYYHLTNASDSLFGVFEQDFVTFSGDTIVIDQSGHFKAPVMLTITGSNGNLIKIRLYNYTQAAVQGVAFTKTMDGSGNLDPTNYYFYINGPGCNKGDRLGIQIGNFTGTSSVVVREGSVFIEKSHEIE